MKKALYRIASILVLAVYVMATVGFEIHSCTCSGETDMMFLNHAEKVFLHHECHDCSHHHHECHCSPVPGEELLPCCSIEVFVVNELSLPSDSDFVDNLLADALPLLTDCSPASAPMTAETGFIPAVLCGTGPGECLLPIISQWRL